MINGTRMDYADATPSTMRKRLCCTRCATLVNLPPGIDSRARSRVVVWWNADIGMTDAPVWVFLVEHPHTLLHVRGLPWALHVGTGDMWKREDAQRLWRALVLPPTVGHGYTRLTPAPPVEQAIARLAARNA